MNLQVAQGDGRVGGGEGGGRGEGGEIRCECLAGWFEVHYYYPAVVYNDFSNGASHKIIPLNGLLERHWETVTHFK